MQISIITVTFNSEKTISDCITSVNNQRYLDIEHIIIDGASNDNTIEIIKSTSARNPKIISEPDKGIYDAMNKGLKEASGDIVGLLNSDDFYSNTNSLSDVMEIFAHYNIDCVFGNINYVSQKAPDKIIRRWESGTFKSGSFKKGWHPAHPSFFVKREVYEKLGYFNLDFKLAADFELMLRFLEKEKISNYYINKALINMRMGGATSGSFINILKQNVECYKAFKRNKIKVSFFYPFFRIVPKLKQYFR